MIMSFTRYLTDELGRPGLLRSGRYCQPKGVASGKALPNTPAYYCMGGLLKPSGG